MKRGMPLQDIPARDAGIRFTQNLVPVVSEADRRCAWFPVPTVALEYLVGHGLEGNGIADVGVIRIPIWPRCQQGSCPRAGIVQIDCCGIANGVPDALPAGLAMA